MDLVFAPSQIETWPLDRLRPYARNAKIHGTDQIAKIVIHQAFDNESHFPRSHGRWIPPGFPGEIACH